MTNKLNRLADRATPILSDLLAEARRRLALADARVESLDAEYQPLARRVMHDEEATDEDEERSIRLSAALETARRIAERLREMSESAQVAANLVDEIGRTHERTARARARAW